MNECHLKKGTILERKGERNIVSSRSIFRSFSGMSIHGTTKLVPGLELKIGFHFFHQDKPRGTLEDGNFPPGILAHRKSEDEQRVYNHFLSKPLPFSEGEQGSLGLHTTLQPRWCLNPKKNALVVSQLPSHLAVLIFSCLTWNNKNKVSQNCPFGCFFKKGYPQQG